MGFRDVDDFMNDMKTYVGEYGKRMQGQQAEKAKMLELQQKFDMLDRQIKTKDIESRTQAEMEKIKADDIRDQRNYDVNLKRIQSQREKAGTEAQVNVVASKMKASSESEKTQASREKAFMDQMIDKFKLMLESEKIKVMKAKND